MARTGKGNKRSFSLRNFVLEAVEYIILLALIAGPLFLLQVYTSHFAWYVNTVENLRLSLPDGITFNYLGFILPLLVSIPLAILIRGKAAGLTSRFKLLSASFVVLYALLAITSVRYPLVASISTGNGLLPLEILAGIYLFSVSFLEPRNPVWSCPLHMSWAL